MDEEALSWPCDFIPAGTSWVMLPLSPNGRDNIPVGALNTVLVLVSTPENLQSTKTELQHQNLIFVCVEDLWPSQPIWVMLLLFVNA